MYTVPTASTHELDARLAAVVDDPEEVAGRLVACVVRRRLVQVSRHDALTLARRLDTAGITR